VQGMGLVMRSLEVKEWLVFIVFIEAKGTIRIVFNRTMFIKKAPVSSMVLFICHTNIDVVMLLEVFLNFYFR